ncbi:MAG TPA: isocitrate lyase/PEP mutase family protein [Xanthobacteraceae bacterium]|jgi:2-methylisocitrate lyase-like PEP mutase family enzyme|nr:isocitrate lyase/PEP mutase family protein [Xanthobacteraceae bacterium]
MTAQHPSAPARLRALLKQDGMIVAPGAYDCISARVIAQAGFSAVYMTGAGTAAMLGYPDFGLVTMSEMAENAGRLAAAVAVPVIADADTGYGNELNVTRTVREYEKRGVAGLHIEDQGFPKKCGHLDDKTVIPLDEYLAKIRAAAAARGNPDFLLIARTDSRAVIGFEEAVTRMNAALKAGADMAFLEAPQTPEEVAAVPRLVKGPCLLNVVSGGKTPVLDLAAAQKLGFKLAILPGLLFQTAVATFDAVLAEVKATQRHPDMKVSIKEKFRRMGSDEWDALRTRFREDTSVGGSGASVKTAAE